jgi:hypothetical protein
MIRRITLRNFMSHAETVIEPADGLTVIVGPNNSGKSAIVEALRTLCTNENSTHVMRHGARECSVTVETDDGHVIEWTRKNSPSYTIDGQLFDRIRGRSGVPPALHAALRLPWVEGAGDDKFDVHLGEQKSPIFLIGSASDAAKFFAASSDAAKLLAMQGRHKSKVSEARSRKRQLDATAATQAERLEALDAVPTLARRMTAAEDMHAAIGVLETDIARLESTIADVCRARRAADVLGDVARELDPLAAPPVLADTGLLAHVTANLRSAEKERVAASALEEATRPLGGPPDMQPAAQLTADIASLTSVSRSLHVCQRETAVLADLAGAPDLADSARIEAAARELREAETLATTRAREAAALAPVSPPPVVEDASALGRTVDALARARAVESSSRAEGVLLTGIDEPPAAEDALPLTSAITDIERMMVAATSHGADLDAAQSDVNRATDAIRRWASESVTCPTCGAALDADAVAHHVAGEHGGRADA